jgi:hypothetical protein
MAENPFLKYVTPDADTPVEAANPFERYVQPGAIQPQPRPSISTGADVLFSAAAGAGEGAHAIPGQLGDTKGFFGGIGTAIGDWLGLDPLTPEQQAMFDNPGKALGLPNIEPPTTSDLEKWTGYEKIKHEPQTPEGKLAKSATSTAIQSVTGGPRAVVMGGAAGLGSEAAGQATEGTWAEPIARILGGLGSGAGTNAVVNAYRRNRPRLTEAPTQEALESTAEFGFDFARELGVDYDAGTASQVFRDLQRDLYTQGHRDYLTPKTFRVLEELTNPPQGAIASLADLHGQRRALARAAKDFSNPEEQKAAMQAIAAIDRFIAHPDPKAVIRGPADAAAAVWGDAMGDYAGAMRSLRLQNAEEATLRSGKATHSGLNIDNKLRQKAAWITNPEYPARRAGYSDTEIDMLNELADGTPSRNTLRYVSKLLGGGGGLGQAAASFFGGQTFGQGPSAAGAIALGVLGAGRGLTGLANRFAQNNWRAIDEAARRRTPLGATMPLAPIPATQMSIPEILAATTGPMRDQEQEQGGVDAVTRALIPQ